VCKTSLRVKPGDDLYYPDNDAFEQGIHRFRLLQANAKFIRHQHEYYPQKEHKLAYTGDQSLHIPLMSAVEHIRLMQGHTFPDKETLMIRITKEANF
jgi:hypothetical protein